jgi:hypothetical protein
VEISNIKSTVRLYTSSPTQTTTVTENEHHIWYQLLCASCSIEIQKLIDEHGSYGQAWPIIDASPVIAAIIRELKGTLSAISQRKKK